MLVTSLMRCHDNLLSLLSAVLQTFEAFQELAEHIYSNRDPIEFINPVACPTSRIVRRLLKQITSASESECSRGAVSNDGQTDSKRAEKFQHMKKKATEPGAPSGGQSTANAAGKVSAELYQVDHH